jgi:hypothetical protein
MAFIKNKENFICEHCAESVEGSGYTNHCPKCLWSKHVDVEPGDRLNDCKGMMFPLRIESDSGEFVIVHKCERCGEEKRNKIAPNDDMEAASMIV